MALGPSEVQCLTDAVISGTPDMDAKKLSSPKEAAAHLVASISASTAHIADPRALVRDAHAAVFMQHSTHIDTHRIERPSGVSLVCCCCVACVKRCAPHKSLSASASRRPLW